jgi:hypothetical protein
MRNEEMRRIASFLTHQQTGVISTIGFPGMWAMPVWYCPPARPSGGQILEVDCLVPRWADVAHHLAKDSRVVLIVKASSSFSLRWLQIQGTVRPVERPDWTCFLHRMNSIQHPESLYLVVRVTPYRIDLVDEDLGWGVHETLEW